MDERAGGKEATLTVKVTAEVAVSVDIAEFGTLGRVRPNAVLSLASTLLRQKAGQFQHTHKGMN